MQITLFPPRIEFAETVLEWRRDPVAMRFNPLLPSTVETLRERIARSATDLTNLKSTEEFMWFLKRGTELVGQVSLQRINLQMMTGEIGYSIAPAARSQGIGTLAVSMLTKEIFEKTELRKVIAIVHHENIASQRILEKVGYVREGLLREHFLVNGIPTDEIIYGILRREFKS